jgi:DNA polymerase V
MPESLLPQVKNLLMQRRLSVQKPDIALALLWPYENPYRLPLPLFSGKVAAGFPSPADDCIEKTLDLNELLVQKPAATFFVRAQGDSMLGAGIHSNDILVVDRSQEPVSGKITSRKNAANAS